MDRPKPRAQAREPASKPKPGAQGHTFGGDLRCTQCGRKWDVNTKRPTVCRGAR